MKEYEVIWEIFNKCPRNQMRDVFVEEVEIKDPEEYIRKNYPGFKINSSTCKELKKLDSINAET